METTRPQTTPNGQPRADPHAGDLIGSLVDAWKHDGFVVAASHQWNACSSQTPWESWWDSRSSALVGFRWPAAATGRARFVAPSGRWSSAIESGLGLRFGHVGPRWPVPAQVPTVRLRLQRSSEQPGTEGAGRPLKGRGVAET